MLNFLAFDLRKLFISKGFWTTILFMMIGCGIAGALMVYSANESYENFQNMMEEQAEMEAEENEGAIQFSIETEDPNANINASQYNLAQTALRETMRVGYFVTFLYSMLSVLFSIYIAIFLGNDFSSGFLKNMLAIKGAKWKWVTAKLGIAIVLMTILFAILTAGGAIVEYLVHDSLTVNWAFIGKIYGLSLILAMIITMVSVAILLITQSKVMTIIMNILMSLGVHASILGLIDQFTRTSMRDALYTKQFAEYRMDGSIDIVPIIILGFVYIIVLYIFNRIYIQRMDFNFEH